MASSPYAAVDRRLKDLEQRLLLIEPSDLEKPNPWRCGNTNGETSHGHLPGTDESDFDWCFVFPHPGVASANNFLYEHASRRISWHSQGVSAEKGELAANREVKFRERLSRGVSSGSGPSCFEEHAAELFRKFLVEDRNREILKGCDTIRSLDAARTACMSLLIHLFRQADS